MTRGYWNVPSTCHVIIRYIFAWLFPLGWWRHKWTAPKTKRNNCVKLQGSNLWSACPSIFFWASDSWYSNNGIRCVMAWQLQKIRSAMFFCWSMEYCENIWTNFHLWGPRSYSSIQDNTTASSSSFQCKESLRKEVLTVAQNTSPMQCKDNLNAIEVWESK